MNRRQLLGDYQTPLPLARQVLATLHANGYYWTRVLEPTCGVGNFIQAVVDESPHVEEIIAVEMQPIYATLAARIDSRLQVYQGDFFDADWEWQTDGPLLIVGNPPWITVAEQGALDATNRPARANTTRLNGLDAITGAANYDIAEAIWLRLLHRYQHTEGVIALLCKEATARRVLTACQQQRLPIHHTRLYQLDAMQWFGASVTACLCTIELNAATPDYTAEVYPSLEASYPTHTMGFAGERLVVDWEAYQELAHLDTGSELEWRQGVKHDAAAVMELHRSAGEWVNGLGEVVEVEDAYLYPLLKSADLRDGAPQARRVILPQQFIGQDTRVLAQVAPRLWAYLNQHRASFEGRKSRIYQGQPPFAVFGVGPYTLAPYKVVVSAFYREPRFVAVGPLDGKPVVVDDTCYLLPVQTDEQAETLAAALNHPVAHQFMGSLAAAGAKRPITKAVLGRVSLRGLLQALDLAPAWVDDLMPVAQQLSLF